MAYFFGLFVLGFVWLFFAPVVVQHVFEVHPMSFWCVAATSSTKCLALGAILSFALLGGTNVAQELLFLGQWF